MAIIRILTQITGQNTFAQSSDSIQVGGIGVGVAPGGAGLIKMALATPGALGELGRDANGNLLIYDGAAVQTVSSSGTHKALRDLIHLAFHGPMDGFPSGAHRTITGQPFPTLMEWWFDNTMTQRYLDLTITRNAQKNPTSEVWRIYAADGTTVLATVTDTITYTGGFETSRTRSVTLWAF